MIFNTKTGGVFKYRINNTEVGRIFTNGNFFIGSSPTDAGYKLDVNGTSRLNGNVNIGSLNVQLANTDGNNVLQITAPGGVKISSDRWRSTTSSSSYINNGYSTKNFVSTTFSNGNFASFDFSNSNSYTPTIANPYTQKLINGAMTINSTAATNSFHGVSISTTDNSASIANNVYAIYADATLGTNTSANRWAGYFVGLISNTLGATFATSSGNVLVGTTTGTGQKLQVNGSIYGTTLQTISAENSSLTSNPWKLGEFNPVTTSLDTSGYVTIDINGTLYRLALAQEV